MTNTRIRSFTSSTGAISLVERRLDPSRFAHIGYEGPLSIEWEDPGMDR